MALEFESRRKRLSVGELERALREARVKLAAETQRADLAQKSAADAWAFAKSVLHTPRPGRVSAKDGPA